jgi:hypothetical protein
VARPDIATATTEQEGIKCAQGSDWLLSHQRSPLPAGSPSPSPARPPQRPPFEWVNDASGWSVVGIGAGRTVQLSSTQFDQFVTIGEKTAVGHYWYQYEDTSVSGDLCLQANVTGSTVTEGGCDANSERQFWYWPQNGNTGYGPLENLYFGKGAYQSGTTMNLEDKASGNAALWTQGPF